MTTHHDCDRPHAFLPGPVLAMFTPGLVVFRSFDELADFAGWLSDSYRNADTTIEEELKP